MNKETKSFINLISKCNSISDNGSWCDYTFDDLQVNRNLLKMAVKLIGDSDLDINKKNIFLDDANESISIINTFIMFSSSPKNEEDYKKEDVSKSTIKERIIFKYIEIDRATLEKSESKRKKYLIEIDSLKMRYKACLDSKIEIKNKYNESKRQLTESRKETKKLSDQINRINSVFEGIK